jgi:hypothetical protein
LLASGCLLQEDRAKSEYVVEARSGGVGTNRSSLLIGVPQMNVPAIVPGQPSFIPEIPLAKKTDQEGVAKIAVFAFNRKTGEPLWQSGVVQSNSNAKDTWVFGAGPFQQGTIRKGTEFAGEPLPIPKFGSEEDGTPQLVSTKVRVTEAAVWPESRSSKPAFAGGNGPNLQLPGSDSSGVISTIGTWTDVPANGTPAPLMGPPKPGATNAPPTFNPPPTEAAPKPAGSAPANIGGQAETAPSSTNVSGIGSADAENPTAPALPSGIAGPAQPIDTLSWYGAVTKRALR